MHTENERPTSVDLINTSKLPPYLQSFFQDVYVRMQGDEGR